MSGTEQNYTLCWTYGQRGLVAARELLEIVLAKDIDVGQYAYTGATNAAFLQAGGDVTGRDFSVVQGWFEIDRSGTRIILLQAGADL